VYGNDIHTDVQEIVRHKLPQIDVTLQVVVLQRLGGSYCLPTSSGLSEEGGDMVLRHVVLKYRNTASQFGKNYLFIYSLTHSMVQNII